MQNVLFSYHKFLDGDNDAFEDVIIFYSQRLFRFAKGYVANEQECEDVVENAFVDLFLKRRKFSDESAMTVYLFKVVRSKAIDLLRKAKKEVSIDEVAQMSDIRFDVEETALLNETKNELHVALGQLKAEYAEVLLLVYGNDLSYKQTATVMRKTEGQVKNLVRRAKLKLKDLMAKES